MLREGNSDARTKQGNWATARGGGRSHRAKAGIKIAKCKGRRVAQPPPRREANERTSANAKSENDDKPKTTPEKSARRKPRGKVFAGIVGYRALGRAKPPKQTMQALIAQRQGRGVGAASCSGDGAGRCSGDVDDLLPPGLASYTALRPLPAPRHSLQRLSKIAAAAGRPLGRIVFHGKVAEKRLRVAQEKCARHQ